MIIYKITNLLNNKIYIGLDTHNNPNYYGSGLYIKKAIKKYGKENFIKEIIDSANTFEELLEKEKYWIKEYNSTDLEIGYNLTEGGKGSHGRKVSDETRRKIGLTKIGNKYGLNYKFTDECKERMSISAKNRKPISEETRQKMSEIHKRENLSEETLSKLSKAATGRIPWNKGGTHSEKAKQKLRDAAKNRKPISEETRQKMRNSAIKREQLKKEKQDQ